MASFVPINGLHHFAYRCRDAEETRVFYEDILGLPLVHVIRQVPGAEYAGILSARAYFLPYDRRLVYRILRPGR